MTTQDNTQTIITDEEHKATLQTAIKQHDLMTFWGDGLFLTTDKERQARAEGRAKSAEQKYIRMMRSKKNNNTKKYQQWALVTALGIKPVKAGYKSSAQRPGLAF